MKTNSIKTNTLTLCRAWEAKHDLPTTRRQVRILMEQALLNAGEELSYKKAQKILRTVRIWLSEEWLARATIRTATRRWKGACIVEDTLLQEYL